MSSRWTNVDAEGKCAKKCLGGCVDVLPCPFVTLVRKLFLMRVLGPAAAVRVVICDCRVVIAGDTGNSFAGDDLADFVWPGGVSNEVAKMVDAVDIARANAGEHGFERRPVPMDV